MSEAMRALLLLPAGRGVNLPPSVVDFVEIRRITEVPAIHEFAFDRPTALCLDRTLLAGRTADRRSLVGIASFAAIVAIGDPGDEAPPEEAPAELLAGWLPAGATSPAVQVVLRAALRHAAALIAGRRAEEAERARHVELAELSRIGAALSTERDLDRLLAMILSQARRLANSDAGSLYLVERSANPEAPAMLRFKLAQNDTLRDLPLEEFTVRIDRGSVAGYVAATGEPLIIADVYDLPADAEFAFNRRFDETFGYRTRSMLVLPMKTHRDEVIGVLQLINRKRSAGASLATPEAAASQVLTYDQRSVDLVTALTSQAAVAVENARLYEDIERLFEGFVTAAVTAIEQRDPTTSGHSGRVATLTTGLADAITRGGAPAPYGQLVFSREEMKELRYAALLHDFGKVGVRELVLVKQKKLYPWDLHLIRHRFAYLNAVTDVEFERERAEFLLEHGAEAYPDVVGRLEERRQERQRELRDYLDAILRANEPTVLAEGSFEALQAINKRSYVDFDGVERPLLSPDELRFLMIRRGNLDESERQEIESHVTHSYRFLDQIPWTRDLRSIPDIAFAHHEKLNGTGYPRQLKAEYIPVQARIMTIADIFDALTATDRPYKRAVPTRRALDILHDEAKGGMIDPHLLQVFTEARVYESVLGITGTTAEMAIPSRNQTPPYGASVVMPPKGRVG